MDYRYIAGFFDGEGTACRIGNSKERWRASIVNTNQEVIKLIMDKVTVGFIYELSTRKLHWKKAWVIAISKQIDVLKFLKSIEPYLIVKKDLVQVAIIDLEKFVKNKKEYQKYKIKKKKQAIELINKGLSYRKIEKKINIPRSTIYCWIKE